MKGPPDSGFSFFETLIIVCIISAIALVIYPTYIQHHNRSKASRLADSFRTFATQLSDYSEEEVEMAHAARNSGITNPILEHIPALKQKSVIGGRWELSCFDETNQIEIRLVGPKADLALLEEVDHLLDDGDLRTGTLTGSYDHLKMILP